ncbi:exonuclease domain-containing protein [Promicromonospora aerolata]|uniref:Exonuclease domain-containing protein n=1 Tax=Promicromonospora aerolata TaxID=195749 RepID=A0ABW4V5A7_9MICO
MTGYAVVDVETTGLFPGGQDRIAEIAIVQVDSDGRVENTWATLVNPGRDLGPQLIHGISAADARHAPTFHDVAGVVAELLRGRTFVAHNAQFDRRFVWHAFATTGYDVPLIAPTTLCTMRTGAQLYPTAPRSLAGACFHHGVTLGSAHEALSDARAAADLLRIYLAGVAFTGAMDEPRDVWERRAGAAGLVAHPAVTKKVRLVVAADPDSMSGKARKAESYGIPVVSESGFQRVLDDLARSTAADTRAAR